jgi:hypothetical protein
MCGSLKNDDTVEPVFWSNPQPSIDCTNGIDATSKRKSE